LERVAFLIEATGERIGAMLNPENLTFRRWAGVRPQRLASGTVAGSGADDPLVLTGGGTTELELDLLFDVDIPGSTIATENVRDLTAPLWAMSERAGRRSAPAPVRFVWGKTWNLLVVVAAAAERLEEFSAGGVPRRSWLRLRLLRVDEEAFDRARRTPPGLLHRPDPGRTTGDRPVGSTASSRAVDEIAVLASDRLDLIAARHYGDPGAWRGIAAYNELDDPRSLQTGMVLRLPPLNRLDAAS